MNLGFGGKLTVSISSPTALWQGSQSNTCYLVPNLFEVGNRFLPSLHASIRFISFSPDFAGI